MDFLLTDDLDLKVENNIIGTQLNGETTLLQAFFSDARVQEKRGYWLGLPLSEMWQFDQKRLTQETVNDLNETAREVAKELVEVVKLYDRIETDAFIDDGILTLRVQAFNKKDIIIDRKFAI